MVDIHGPRHAMRVPAEAVPTAVFNTVCTRFEPPLNVSEGDIVLIGTNEVRAHDSAGHLVAHYQRSGSTFRLVVDALPLQPEIEAP